ncbi:hypothetical protein M1M24_gp57 [Polaribacter phage Freya_1]|uniref:Uncharacterized protein n=1 Tax=Polaribacter phage Freya_1 TaxID=2745662 RepID=A0A8E4ZCP7_9CAUD|nr:hypothetical protein M1M24_gp57 [Polaribacter phage Freya_1]QQV90994.1 hypothetical protein Freya2_57 [Polaribacter phage Freya_2]QQV91062.1 hypothetical protein Freya3_57 [Polaribacter phage Freya_3]QQV91130.1 hypothetical protein Freya4_57 [Polaribacter phage Freya_4]QQV91205.1 hypothetical protein Freya8_64 [Polaribacter phage Freya_8]QQV91282.1 hypothetical protein Freya9_66 [Polaribacter phage Freya_9]QQV91360.1 hypothetical protein Freya10_67 [Polaribacter phage Freya_10]QYV99939.1 
MKNREKGTELVNLLGLKYKDQSDKLVQNNMRLSTKLTAFIFMFEAYYDEYSQNQKEFIKLVNEAKTEQAQGDEVFLKQVNRATKNKLNKIKNQDARFLKFSKEFNGEFTKYFNEGKLEVSETLMDALDAFWDTVVKVDENTVSIDPAFCS